jgi:cyanophycin synthetase
MRMRTVSQLRYYTKITPKGIEQNLEDPMMAGTMLIIEAAEKMGMKWREVPGTRIIELDYKGNIKYFRSRIPSPTTDVGFFGCRDKFITKLLLMEKGVTVAKGYKNLKTDSQEQWRSIFDSLKKPLVVKPTHASHGDSVKMNVMSWEEFAPAVEEAFLARSYPDAGVIVEETFEGKEYRILTTREKVLGIMYRIPANVIGDGKLSVQQLIELKNLNFKEDWEGSLYPDIIIDEDLKNNLKNANLTLESVPAENQQVWLRTVSNISQGGDGVDVTDDVDPSVKEIALQAIRAIPGLEIAGLDFLTKDITQPQSPNSHIIIEVNANPELSIHDVPSIGKNRGAIREFLTLIYPELKGQS